MIEPEIKKDIIKRVGEGESITSLSKEHGVSRTSIHYWLNNVGKVREQAKVYRLRYQSAISSLDIDIGLQEEVLKTILESDSIKPSVKIQAQAALNKLYRDAYMDAVLHELDTQEQEQEDGIIDV